MASLQNEFAKHLLIAREKTETIRAQGAVGMMARFEDVKRKIKDKLEAYDAIKSLKASEFEALTQFMQKVKEERSRPPAPPMKRPEGLELSLIGVALFSGNEIFSKAIRSITKSAYSHVALLLHDAKNEPNDPEGWYIYSANGSASQIMADRQLPQVQLEKWTTAMEGYDGAVWTRLMLFEKPAPTSDIVTELVDKYIGLPYERQLLIMLKAINRTNVEGAGHADSAFCSEICYRFLAASGVLQDTEVPENVWPKDFSPETDRLKLVGAGWGEIAVMKEMAPKATKATKDKA